MREYMQGQRIRAKTYVETEIPLSRLEYEFVHEDAPGERITIPHQVTSPPENGTIEVVLDGEIPFGQALAKRIRKMTYGCWRRTNAWRRPWWTCGTSWKGPRRTCGGCREKKEPRLEQRLHSGQGRTRPRRDSAGLAGGRLRESQAHGDAF